METESFKYGGCANEGGCFLFIYFLVDVVRTKRRQLCKAICEFNVRWYSQEIKGAGPMITNRYSHSAVVYNDSMYVFGGCTNSMTTFNDLWRLNLSTRKWVRIKKNSLIRSNRIILNKFCNCYNLN